MRLKEIIKSLAFDFSGFAFQTGPYFSNSFAPSSLNNTKYARRILIIKDANGNIYAAAIVGAENKFDGPTLGELDDILFNKLDSHNFVEAINLDGGSASTLYVEGGFHLAEFSPVGALLCIQ